MQTAPLPKLKDDAYIYGIKGPEEWKEKKREEKRREERSKGWSVSEEGWWWIKREDAMHGVLMREEVEEGR
jgi:hypothetical protein